MNTNPDEQEKKLEAPNFKNWWPAPARNRSAQMWRDEHSNAFNALMYSKTQTYNRPIIWLARSLVLRKEEDDSRADPVDQRTVLHTVGRLLAKIGPEGNEESEGEKRHIHYMTALLFRHWTQRCCQKSLVEKVGQNAYVTRAHPAYFIPDDSSNSWRDYLAQLACQKAGAMATIDLMKPWTHLKKDISVFLDGWEAGMAENNKHIEAGQPTRLLQTNQGLCCMALRSRATSVSRRLSDEMADRLWLLESWMGPGLIEVPSQLVAIEQAQWDRHLLERFLRKVTPSVDLAQGNPLKKRTRKI